MTRFGQQYQLEQFTDVDESVSKLNGYKFIRNIWWHICILKPDRKWWIMDSLDYLELALRHSWEHLDITLYIMVCGVDCLQDTWNEAGSNLIVSNVKSCLGSFCSITPDKLYTETSQVTSRSIYLPDCLDAVRFMEQFMKENFKDDLLWTRLIVAPPPEAQDKRWRMMKFKHSRRHFKLHVLFIVCFCHQVPNTNNPGHCSIFLSKQ